MVLVFCILYNHTSILQTKFSYGEGHEARRIGPYAMPLDQHIEGGHGEREPRLKIGPHTVHNPLEMTDQRQQCIGISNAILPQHCRECILWAAEVQTHPVLRRRCRGGPALQAARSRQAAAAT